MSKPKVGLISPPYRAGLANALLPLELPLCLYKKGDWLACRDPGEEGTWVNFRWVCAAGFSKPLPHFSLFCG